MADSTGSFRASFVLALKDDLSAGLRKIIADVKALQRAARELGFKPLEGADAIVNRVDRDVQQLNRDLGQTTRQAESAAAALRRTGAAELGRAREQAAQARQAHDVIAMRPSGALTPYAPSQAGAGGGRGGGRGIVPYAGGDEPFERGPIDLNYRRSLRSRAGEALSGARRGAGQFGSQVGLAGAAMAGISLMAPIREAAEFDNVLTHIAITAGASAETVRGKVAEMAATYRAMALSTRQSSHDVAESAQFLITTGIGEEMTNRLLPIIAKAATAYNTPMRDAVQGAFSMHEELKIAPEQMQGALSATALAAKQGHFSFSDFSSYLPSIAAQAGQTGFTGRAGLNSLLAALETSRRGAGTSGQAATNLQDFLGYINAPIGTKSFAKEGINLPALKLAAERAGQNPLEAVMDAVRRRTTSMTPAQRANFMGKIFHNQEARIFASTMLAELRYYEEVKAKVTAAGEHTIDEDFAKAQNLHTRLVELAESSHQLTQRIGLGFSWVVPVGTFALTGVLVSLRWLDHHAPGLADGLIGITGGMLGLVTVMGVLGTVAGPVRAGWQLLRLGAIMRTVFSLGALRLLVNPYTAVLVGIGAAAIYIWRRWDRFRGDFTRMWEGIRSSGHGVREALAGAFNFDGSRITRGLSEAWRGTVAAWDALWRRHGIMENLMDGLISALPDWGQRFVTGLGSVMQRAMAGWAAFVRDMQAALNSLRMPDVHPNIPGVTTDPRLSRPPADPAPPGADRGRSREPAATPAAPGPAARPTGFRLEAPGGAPAATVQRASVRIQVEVDDRGTRVRARSDHPDVTIDPARGPMPLRA